jgi:hypothetical protein
MMRNPGKIDRSDLEYARTEILPLRESQRWSDAFEEYFPVLFASGDLIDVTEKHKAKFRRCIPVFSIAEKGFLTNTISILVRQKGRKTVWHVFGGKCSIFIERWDPKERNPKSFFVDEVRHVGLCCDNVDTDDKSTKEEIRTYMREAGYDAFTDKEIRRRLALLRPRFPRGVYLQNQPCPRSKTISDDLGKLGIDLPVEKRVSLQMEEPWY